MYANEGAEILGGGRGGCPFKTALGDDFLEKGENLRKQASGSAGTRGANPLSGGTTAWKTQVANEKKENAVGWGV